MMEVQYMTIEKTPKAYVLSVYYKDGTLDRVTTLTQAELDQTAIISMNLENLVYRLNQKRNEAPKGVVLHV